MKNKKFLIISEGQITEPRIYQNHLAQVELLPNDVSIFTYQASLHDLIRLVDDEDLDTIDFKQLLIERELS